MCLPVDSLVRHRHARYEQSRTRPAGRLASQLHSDRFHQSPLQRLPARRSIGPYRDRMPVTTFRSPATAAPLDASIPGSTFPACHFASRSALPRPVRLLARLPPLVRPSYGCFNARNPLPDSCRPLPAFAGASTPLQDVAVPRDQSVPLPSSQ
jgi:hypothetical protein